MTGIELRDWMQLLVVPALFALIRFVTQVRDRLKTIEKDVEDIDEALKKVDGRSDTNRQSIIEMRERVKQLQVGVRDLATHRRTGPSIANSITDFGTLED